MLNATYLSFIKQKEADNLLKNKNKTTAVTLDLTGQRKKKSPKDKRLTKPADPMLASS